MEKFVNSMEKTPDWENTVNFYKDYIIENAIVTEKAIKAIKPETINSWWRKLCSDVVHNFTGFMTEPIKEIMKDCEYGKKMGAEGWKISRYGY